MSGLVWYPLLVAVLASPLAFYLILVLGIWFALSRRVPRNLALAIGALAVITAYAALVVPWIVAQPHPSIVTPILEAAGLLYAAGFTLIAGTLARTALVWLRNQP